jgi:GxxExxY protein
VESPAKHAKRREMQIRNEDLLFKDESYAIVRACYAVYRDKGCGFLEAVYQECLGIEFEFCEIPARAQQSVHLSYRGRTLRQVYQPDFICYGKIIVEIKAVSALATGFQLRFAG